jgi:hypothetical protein
MPAIMDAYEPKGIANGNERELFFRALPSKTLQLRRRKYSGGKLCEEKLTVFFCGFLTGETDKLLVVGNSTKPWCLRTLA